MWFKEFALKIQTRFPRPSRSPGVSAPAEEDRLSPEQTCLARSYLEGKTELAVGPDYLLGPDDTIVINAWGPTELSYFLTINPEGSVVIPEMGLVYLSSLTLGQAREELGTPFEKFYPGINLHVTVYGFNADK